MTTAGVVKYPLDNISRIELYLILEGALRPLCILARLTGGFFYAVEAVGCLPGPISQATPVRFRPPLPVGIGADGESLMVTLLSAPSLFPLFFEK